MQLAVRIDKRPGESHMALDGKKIAGIYILRQIKLAGTKFPHAKFS
jgi:hypothetical protein